MTGLVCGLNDCTAHLLVLLAAQLPHLKCSIGISSHSATRHATWYPAAPLASVLPELNVARSSTLQKREALKTISRYLAPNTIETDPISKGYQRDSLAVRPLHLPVLCSFVQWKQDGVARNTTTEKVTACIRCAVYVDPSGPLVWVFSSS